MSSETVIEAMFLISAVIAAALLINAIFPLVYNTASTIGLTSQRTDARIRTDIKIVNYQMIDTTMTVWIKNTGLTHISLEEVEQSSVFAGTPSSFDIIPSAQVNYDIADVSGAGRWDPGEILIVTVSGLTISGDTVYFAIVLPVGEKDTITWDKSIP